MALPPRCEKQIGTQQHAPFRIIICPKSAIPGGKYCPEHDTLGEYLRRHGDTIPGTDNGYGPRARND